MPVEHFDYFYCWFCQFCVAEYVDRVGYLHYDSAAMLDHAGLMVDFFDDPEFDGTNISCIPCYHCTSDNGKIILVSFFIAFAINSGFLFAATRLGVEKFASHSLYETSL